MHQQQQQPQNNIPPNFQQQQEQSPSIWSNNQPPPQLNFTVQIEAVNVQQMKLREQIRESENNLQAQHQVAIKLFAVSRNDHFNSLWLHFPPPPSNIYVVVVIVVVPLLVFVNEH